MEGVRFHFLFAFRDGDVNDPEAKVPSRRFRKRLCSGIGWLSFNKKVQQKQSSKKRS